MLVGGCGWHPRGQRNVAQPLLVPSIRSRFPAICFINRAGAASWGVVMNLTVNGDGLCRRHTKTESVDYGSVQYHQ